METLNFVFLIMFSFCSKVDKIREFIKNVYVERRYVGGKTSDKPPRDVQALCPWTNFYIDYMLKELLSVFCFWTFFSPFLET